MAQFESPIHSLPSVKMSEQVSRMVRERVPSHDRVPFPPDRASSALSSKLALTPGGGKGGRGCTTEAARACAGRCRATGIGLAASAIQHLMSVKTKLLLIDN